MGLLNGERDMKQVGRRVRTNAVMDGHLQGTSSTLTWRLRVSALRACSE
jgi:hypothetical protein